MFDRAGWWASLCRRVEAVLLVFLMTESKTALPFDVVWECGCVRSQLLLREAFSLEFV